MKILKTIKDWLLKIHYSLLDCCRICHGELRMRKHGSKIMGECINPSCELYKGELQ